MTNRLGLSDLRCARASERDSRRPRTPRRKSGIADEFVVDARAVEAHDMHLAGHPWSVIAARVGYASPRVCSMAVTAYLQRAAVKQAPDQRRQQLDLERARLDALQAAFWQRAVSGDVKAAAVVLKVVVERSRLPGLTAEPNQPDTPRTIIIDGSEEQFIAGMKSVVERREARRGASSPRSATDDDTGWIPPTATDEA